MSNSPLGLVDATLLAHTRTSVPVEDAILQHLKETESIMSAIQINRPWMQSFGFETVPFSDSRVEQFHKLARNYVCSLNMGCANVKHVNWSGRDEDLSKLSEKELYLAWVKNWKIIYNELSHIIRLLKLCRRTIRFPNLTARQKDLWTMLNGSTNQTLPDYMRHMSAKHLERLQETAQVLLNARYNAKLASAEKRRRAMALSA